VQAVPVDEAPHNGLVEWGVEIVIACGTIAGARIEAPRLVAGIGQADEGVVLVDGHGPSRGGYRLDPAAPWFAGEGQCDFEFAVVRKRFRPLDEDGAAGRIKLVVALVAAVERTDDIVGVAQQQVAGVDKNTE